MRHEIKVRKISNGYILSYDVDCDDGSILTLEQVMQVDQDCDGLTSEREALIEALYEIVDYFDLGYQKHSKPNEMFIKIAMIPGEDFWKEEDAEYEEVEVKIKE